MLEAVRDRRLDRFVFASSSSVYGDDVSLPMNEEALPQPVSPYGVSKLAAEQLCYLYFANYGVPATSLRYFTVYGPRQRPDMAFHRFLQATHRGDRFRLFGDGKQTRDFTFVTDAVAATVSAGERGVPGRVYNIGGGSRVSMNEVIEMIGRVISRARDRSAGRTSAAASRGTTARPPGGPRCEGAAAGRGGGAGRLPSRRTARPPITTAPRSCR